MNAREYGLELSLMRLRAKRNRRKFMIGLFIWCVCIWGILHRMYGVSVVYGNSMRPAFLSGDIVVYQRNVKHLNYGDVIVLQSWLDQEMDYVKRISALPGDVVSVDEKGYLTLDGEEVKEAEILHGYQQTDSPIQYPYRLAEQEYFCMGDNRPVSLDSRTFGPVAISQIRGKEVLLIRFGHGRGI